MLNVLASSNRVAGVKQSGKAVREGRAARVFLARDADPAITEPLAELAQANGAEIVWVGKMHDLGRACNIDVGAAAAATLPEC